MKTYYEDPIIRITKFYTENVVTASGEGLQKKMESEGYAVTTVDLKALKAMIIL